ncbi:MAG: hypothetical protein QM817_02445 [Archangium sp.]
MNALVLVALAAMPFTDSRNGFSFELPDGYVRLEVPLAQAIHSFRREDETGFAVLSITPLGGIISQTPSIHSVVESSAREAAAKTGTIISSFEYREQTWKDFQLEVMVMRAEQTPSGPAFSMTAQIPLASGAVQVLIAGPATEEARITREFTGVIASFKGETNWKPGEVERREAGRIAGTIAGLVCSVGFVAIAAWLLFRKKPITAGRKDST